MLLFLLAFSALFLFYNLYWRRRHLPPGPTPLPLIGNVHEFLRRPPGEEAQLEWKRKYGPVFTIWLANRPVVVVADYKLMVETFQRDGDAYAGRADEIEYMNLVRGGVNGVIFVEDDLWRDQRRFSMQVLRDLGAGRNLMESRILDEIGTLIRRINERIDEHASKEFPMEDLMDLSVGSIINYLIFGYAYTDDRIHEFNDLKKRAQSFVRVNGHPVQRMIRDWPQLYRYLPYFKDKFKEARDSINYLHNFFRERVEIHRKELRGLDIRNTTPTDFVTAYLQEWARRDDEGRAHYFNDRQLVVLLFDLWVAGQETTSNTLLCFLAHLIHNPDVQRKAHAELDSAVGSDRLVTLADRANLPYIAAIIQETQRMANLLPINLLHRVTRDVNVGGYSLKKGTWIVPQISIVLYDPDVYEQPKRFKPERFLDERGNLKRSDELIPFSIGKRQCLGESLARMELYLFIANLLNQFEFTPGKELPSLERPHGVTVRPKYFECRVRKRFG